MQTNRPYGLDHGSVIAFPHAQTNQFGPVARVYRIAFPHTRADEPLGSKLALLEFACVRVK
jgi:mannitol/fructose-specific phosphotransferase system IIA component (Ntr-type)